MDMSQFEKPAEPEEESKIVKFLRQYMLANGGLGGADINMAEAAKNVEPMVEPSSSTVKNYAEGGMVNQGNDMDPDDLQGMEGYQVPKLAGGAILGINDPFKKGLIPPTSSQMPAMSPPIAPPPMAPPVQPQLPTQAPAAPAMASKPMPGMPPSVTPDELQGYLNKQRESIGKYSPDEQYNREMQIGNQRNGLGNRLAYAAATFAGPEYTKGIDDRWNAQLSGEVGARERSRAGTMEKAGAESKIDMQDPGSIASKTYQNAYADIFSKMGYSPESVAKMPASQIQTLADLGVRYSDAQTQAELKNLSLMLQGMSAKAMAANQESQNRRENQKMRTDAASEVLKRSGNAKVLGLPIPFTSDVSGAEKDKARKVLSEQMNLGSEQSGQESEALRWAQENADDPRAAKILQKLGKQ